MSAILSTVFIECDGDCGAKIEITVRGPAGKGLCDAAAEALGWTTRDKGKKQEVYCPFCQKRAARIVNGS